MPYVNFAGAKYTSDALQNQVNLLGQKIWVANHIEDDARVALASTMTDRKRRAHFHPELQAEIEFGILQSTDTTAREIFDNFKVFLEHDDDWQDANDTILDMRGSKTQEEFPAMNDLAASVASEIEWQTAIWNEDYWPCPCLT